jgi:hypothetical protein
MAKISCARRLNMLLSLRFLAGNQGKGSAELYSAAINIAHDPLMRG